MSDSWGDPHTFSPTYSQALRQFVRFQARTATLINLRRLSAEQNRLEEKWFERREESRRNGASPEKSEAFDRRIHVQANEFAKDLSRKLGDEMKITLFQASTSPTVKEDRAKFMQFLADLISE